MAGFTFAYRLSGGSPTIQPIIAQDTATYYKGDIVNLETGEADFAATNDTAFLGAVLETAACTDSVTKILVITDLDAVYSVTDDNARVIGATLDLSTTPGAMGVTTNSNADVVVVADSGATEPTLVKFTTGNHWLD